MNRRGPGDGSRGRQSGQAIVVMAAVITVLVMLGALVFDASMAMSDRRIMQAQADAAALAGARSFGNGSGQGANVANWTAMEYLAGPLAFSLPTGNCQTSTACAAGAYSLGNYTVTLADVTVSGGSYPTMLDVTISHQQASLFARVFGITSITDAAAARAVMPQAATAGAVYALESLGGDATVNGGGGGTPNVTGPVYTAGNFGANNGTHAVVVTTTQDNPNGTACPGSDQNFINYSGTGNSGDWTASGSGSVQQNYNQPAPAGFDNYAPSVNGSTYTSTATALDGNGNWMPGTYDGIYPSGGLMNPGVYKIINVKDVKLGSITNAVWPNPNTAGTADPNGAVVVVLDGSDTGTLDISNAVLNGIDDTYGASYSGSRDPQGTHNFVLFGGGSNPYAGGVKVNGQATTNLTGIVWMPQATLSTSGQASPTFIGSASFYSTTINGSGNGIQSFEWICGLNAVVGNGNSGGLVR